MTPVGHSLTGTAIALMVIPPGASRRRKALTIVTFMFLANVPDLKIPGWGHDRYHISHSIFVNLAAILLGTAAIYLTARLRSSRPSLRLLFAGACAILSHMLMDSFYNHGYGIAVFWPFSKARLILPIPWLTCVRTSPPPLTLHTLRVCAIEFLTFSPLVVVAFLIGTAIRRRSGVECGEKKC